MGEPRPFRGALVHQTCPLFSTEALWHLVGHWPEPGLRAAASLSFMCFSNLFFLFMLLCFFGFLDFCLYVNVHFYFCNLSFFPFFFFPLLCHAVSHFEQRPIKKNKREELNNSKMSCYTINLLCCGEWWKDAFLESYCLLEFELCHFLCNCGASYFSSKLMSPCPPPVYKTGYSIIIVPSLQCCEFSVI